MKVGTLKKVELREIWSREVARERTSKTGKKAKS